MTLMKSVLLGSAATLVVVAGAQAADLPTKKGAPAVQYVKVCNIAGVAGFVLPGSDTCLKISGGIEAMAAFGSYDTQLNMSPLGRLPSRSGRGALTGPITVWSIAATPSTATTWASTPAATSRWKPCPTPPTAR